MGDAACLPKDRNEQWCIYLFWQNGLNPSEFPIQYGIKFLWRSANKGTGKLCTQCNRRQINSWRWQREEERVVSAACHAPSVKCGIKTFSIEKRDRWVFHHQQIGMGISWLVGRRNTLVAHHWCSWKTMGTLQITQSEGFCCTKISNRNLVGPKLVHFTACWTMRSHQQYCQNHLWKACCAHERGFWWPKSRIHLNRRNWCRKVCKDGCYDGKTQNMDLVLGTTVLKTWNRTLLAPQ